MHNLISTCSSIWLLDWDALNFDCADLSDSPSLAGWSTGLGQVGAPCASQHGGAVSVGVTVTGAFALLWGSKADLSSASQAAWLCSAPCCRQAGGQQEAESMMVPELWGYQWGRHLVAGLEGPH